MIFVNKDRIKEIRKLFLTVLDREQELRGKTVFCQDFADDKMVKAVMDEGGIPVFVDVSIDDWGMDPIALDKAFEIYPETRLVIFSHIYGFPGQVEEISKICKRHGAMLIEDISEAGGAKMYGKNLGSHGDYILSGKMCDDDYVAKMEQIYEHYEERLLALDIWMNPIGQGAEPNYASPCMTIEGNGLCESDNPVHGKSCPAEIEKNLKYHKINAERVYIPMHMQSEFEKSDFISIDGSRFTYEESELFPMTDESRYIYERSVKLPAYPEMTEEEQDRIIDIIYDCFNKDELKRLAWV